MEIGSSVCKLKIRCYDIVILVIIFVMLFEPARSWDNEDLELFDLVEEMSTLNKTFYEVLGLTQTASSSDIRRAYRRLSLKLHPDHNKDPNAATQFRQLVSISEVLRDELKRQKYDHILEEGLPDWRQAVYYYRKVRKFGFIELSIILFLIMTSGHYIVLWSIYFERKYELEEILSVKLKKRDKKLKKNKQITDEISKDIIEETKNIPKPQFQNLIPFMIVRGLFSVIISLPQGYEFVKRIVIHLGGLITTPAKNEDEPLTAQEERPRKPRRRRVFEIPDFTSECLLESLDGPCSETSSGQVTSDKNCLEKTTCDREQVPLNTSEWTEEDIAALTKAMNKIPSGTNERWEKIAQLLNRSFQDVTAMAKKLKSTTTSKHVSAAIQGMTANKLAKEIVNTEITKSEHFDIQKDHVTYEKVTSNNCDDYVINQTNECVQRYSTNVPQTIKTDTNEIWTQVQQRALELALAHFPRGTDERWEKIAKCVPDKSKEDCIKRFKYLAEQVKKKRLPVEKQASS